MPFSKLRVMAAVSLAEDGQMLLSVSSQTPVSEVMSQGKGTLLYWAPGFRTPMVFQ